MTAIEIGSPVPEFEIVMELTTAEVAAGTTYTFDCVLAVGLTCPKIL
mgnify:CR=1 FL=1